MRNRILISNTALIISTLFVSSAVNATSFVGNGTPTVYNVTLQNVSFHKAGTPSNSFISYASGSGLFDIAAANPGSPIGTLQSTSQLGGGFYDQMRFQVSTRMVVKGAYVGLLSNGLPCRTVANGTVISNPAGDGSISQAALGSTDGGTPEEETIVVPSGYGITLPSGYVLVGTSLAGLAALNIQGTVPVSMTVAGSVPTVTTTFNVTNSLMFLAYGPSNCLVIPGPPVITVTT
jgi:hypothetical protein